LRRHALTHQASAAQARADRVSPNPPSCLVWRADLRNPSNTSIVDDPPTSTSRCAPGAAMSTPGLWRSRPQRAARSGRHARWGDRAPRPSARRAPPRRRRTVGCSTSTGSKAVRRSSRRPSCRPVPRRTSHSGSRTARRSTLLRRCSSGCSGKLPRLEPRSSSSSSPRATLRSLRRARLPSRLASMPSSERSASDRCWPGPGARFHLPPRSPPAAFQRCSRASTFRAGTSMRRKSASASTPSTRPGSRARAPHRLRWAAVVLEDVDRQQRRDECVR
jgi:hypothetical protein